MKLRKLISLALCLLLVAAAQCALADAVSNKDGTVVDGSYDPYHVEQELAAHMAEQQLKYAPKVTELANGVRVQRTPQDDGIYNTYVLKADQRGCAACHADLQATLNNLPMGHMDINLVGDVDVTVEHCISCHTYSPGYVEEFYQFGSVIHGLHTSSTFTAMGGSCQSCHDANESTGKMELWDRVKYDRLRGITEIAAEDIDAEFAFDQTTTSSDVDDFSLNWLVGTSDYMIYDDYVSGLVSDHQTLLDWEITVDGMVDHPFTMTMAQIIDTFPSVTETKSMHCTLDPATGGLISTWEVTGVSVKAILEYAGVQEGAIELYTAPLDNACTYPTLLSTIEQNDGLLVYQINGHDLRYYQGFPVVAWMSGMGAPSYAKQVSVLTVAADPIEELYLYQGWVTEDGGYFNKPNTAILNTKEGQIIDPGEPYTVEGFADAYEDPIVAMEFSMDNGQTWKRFPVENAKIGTWVYWYYTFTPAEEAAYVIKARAVTESGLVNRVPAAVLVNAQY